MSATATELTLIRMYIGDSDSNVFTDAELQAFWADADAKHTTTDRRVLRIQVEVDALSAIMADAAKRVSYRSNESSENMSDVFKHLATLKGQREKELSDALSNATGGSTRVGRPKRKPRRTKEWPDA
jgi:hypothetical protein